MRSIVIAAAVLLVGRPVFAQPTQLAQPAPAPTLPPATGTAPPAYPYPPGYPYSPDSSYPPAYSYPAPYPAGYPPSPQGYSPYASPYPAYPSGYPPAAGYPPAGYADPPPDPVPSGRWRLGASLMLAPQGTLSYSLNYKGEPLLAYAGSTATTVGVVPYLQLDVLRYLYLAFAVQVLPSVKWKSTAASAGSNNNIFGGTGREVDLLPQVGLSVPASRRIRLLAFAAPGYSLLFASNLVKVYADPGTAHGFVFQTGFGMILSLGTHAFLDFRGAYQWGFQNNQVQSATTGASADVEVHSRFFGLQAGGGYWF